MMYVYTTYSPTPRALVCTPLHSPHLRNLIFRALNDGESNESTDVREGAASRVQENVMSNGGDFKVNLALIARQCMLTVSTIGDSEITALCRSVRCLPFAFPLDRPSATDSFFYLCLALNEIRRPHWHFGVSSIFFHETRTHRSSPHHG